MRRLLPSVLILIGTLLYLERFTLADPKTDSSVVMADGEASTSTKNSEAWPLEKGTKWTYEATVTYISGRDPKTNSEIEKTETVHWTSEVRDTFSTENYTVAWVHGSVDDLCWYTPATKPSDRLILKVGTDYYQDRTDDVGTLFSQIKAAGDTWGTTIFQEFNKAELIVPLPLALDKRFGGDVSNYARRRYCWVVDGVSPMDGKGILGCPAGFHSTEYSMDFWTNPDESWKTFVPGLGITSLRYHHHGTTMDVDARLVEFHKGQSEAR